MQNNPPNHKPPKHKSVQESLALNPLDHAFVAANAGSGKTTILINRLLSILLRGVPPHQILCLTFTKAAAGEMAQRLHKRLQSWTWIDESELLRQIAQIEHDQGTLSHEIAAARIKIARGLFRRVLDAPGGLRLQTIHSFSESLLRRFPLEAGIAADFQVIEEAQSDFLKYRALRHMLRHLKNPNLQIALNQLFVKISLVELQMLTQQLAATRINGASFLENMPPLADIKPALKSSLGLNPAHEPENTLDDLYERLQLYKGSFSILLEYLSSSTTKTHKKFAELTRDILRRIAEETQDQKQQLFDQLCQLLLKSDQDVFISRLSKKDQEKHLDLDERLTLLANEMIALKQAKKAWDAYALTLNMLQIAPKLWQAYRDLKQQIGALDYDDQIQSAAKLLHDYEAAWVHYKLDKGLNHILVDEAQDTNALQWDIIHALSAPFFDEAHIQGRERTLFIVGDVKQSIYGFQGARPDSFLAARTGMERAHERTGQLYREITLNLSYRSLPNILKAVDLILKQQSAALGLRDDQSLSHRANRANEAEAGCVTLWPPFLDLSSRKQTDKSWVSSDLEMDDAAHHPSGDERLANEIALYIKNRIATGYLAKKDHAPRPIMAGDFMILTRVRSNLVQLITRALRSHNIPVAGADRMAVMDQLAVKDMITCLEWLINTQDDLSLATLLKSPFCGVGEDMLFDLAHDRGNASLYDRVKAGAGENSHLAAIAAWLRGLLSLVDYIPPYEMLRKLLILTSPAAQSLNGKQALMARLGSEIDDPIEALMDLALEFEAQNTTSIQAFLGWLQQISTQIKRENEDQPAAVRIMTIHAAKGLQAPIVIVPEHIGRKPKPGKKIIWLPHEHDLLPAMPVIITKQADIPQAATRVIEQQKRQEFEESMRLFYVAMTRAEDELLLCGYGKIKADSSFDDFKKQHENSWLVMAYDCFERHALNEDRSDPDHAMITKFDFAPTHDGAYPIKYAYRLGAPSLRLETLQKLNPVLQKDQPQLEWLQPEWLQVPAPMIEPLREPLAPSKIDEDSDLIARSPLERQSDQGLASMAQQPYLSAVQKGILIHALLEYLPKLPANQRIMQGLAYLHHQTRSQNDSVLQAMVDHAIGILNDPKFGDIFKDNARSEVMIKGILTLNGKKQTINGTVDRLVIEQDRVLIIDFKTSEAPPSQLNKVPLSYLRQMRLYRDLLSGLYPDKAIETALLWTAIPELMPLPNSLLDQI
ncbi:MAG: double-strand break repair helicase AddA [Alphaproteobacteria bacterium]